MMNVSKNIQSGTLADWDDSPETLADIGVERFFEATLSTKSMSQKSLSQHSGDSDDAHGPVDSNTTTPRTFINFLKSYIGSGVLGLPYAFYQGGVILSIVCLLVLSILSNYCIRLLLEVSDELEKREGKKASFGGIGRTLFGNAGRLVVDISLIFTQTGFCCVYVIFISSNLNGLYSGIPVWGYVFLALPFLTAVCWVRSFKFLAYVSLAGQASMLLGLSLIMVFSMISAVENTPPIKAFNFIGVPVYFGMVVFAYEGIGLVIPMRRAMEHSYNYIAVLDIGYMFTTVLFIMFGTIGYCGYGASIDPNGITLNLPQDSIWTTITIISLIFAIYATYPVQMFPVITILEGLIFKRYPNVTGAKLTWSKNLVRALLVIFTSLIAISIPYFSLFVSLVGALGSSVLAYILPCCFHLKLFKEQKIQSKVFNWILVVFGIFASIVASGVTIFQLILAIFHIPPPTL